MLFATGQSMTGSDGEAVPVLYVGSDGKLRGRFWNGNAATMASPSPVNDDQWHHVVLTGAHNTQSLFLDGVQVATLPGLLGNVDPYNLLARGHLGTRSWPAEPLSATGDFSGSIAEVAFYDHPLGATDIAEHHDARTGADRLTKITRPGGAIEVELAYDGRADRVSQYTDEHGGTYTVEVPTVEGRCRRGRHVWRGRW